MVKTDTVERAVVCKELSLAEQISVISRTAYALAHELKTPLTSIKLNVEMLDEDISMPENKKRSLAILKKEISRLSGIVDSYLNFTRQDNLEFTEVNLIDFVEEIRLLLLPDLNKRNIEFINLAGHLNFMADRDKLKSVFLNLITNSIEAIGLNGKIEVSTETDNVNGRFSVFIKDNGCGISDPEKIFEPFYTTKNTGNGLGLVLAAEILRKHNSSIKLCSSERGETVFEISFSL